MTDSSRGKLALDDLARNNSMINKLLSNNTGAQQENQDFEILEGNIYDWTNYFKGRDFELVPQFVRE